MIAFLLALETSVKGTDKEQAYSDYEYTISDDSAVEITDYSCSNAELTIAGD